MEDIFTLLKYGSNHPQKTKEIIDQFFVDYPGYVSEWVIDETTKSFIIRTHHINVEILFDEVMNKTMVRMYGFICNLGYNFYTTDKSSDEVYSTFTELFHDLNDKCVGIEYHENFPE